MPSPSPVAYAALGLSLLALFSPFAGVADAAGHHIGKNLVVTKSIKNGAVTGGKVKDGSLTAADLAPGTIPVPGGGKSVVMASRGTLSISPNDINFMAPSGAYTSGPIYGIAPVAMSVADLRVVTPQEGIGQAVQVSLSMSNGIGADLVPLLTCTVGAQTGGCSANGPATVPAGYLLTITTTNGPGGATGGFIAVGYTVRVP
jgi:hypothetical protein